MNSKLIEQLFEAVVAVYARERQIDAQKIHPFSMTDEGLRIAFVDVMKSIFAPYES
jgi:hypothetical protein